MKNNLKEFCKELLALKEKYGVEIEAWETQDSYGRNPRVFIYLQDLKEFQDLEIEGYHIRDKAFNQALKDFIDAP